MSHSPAHFLVVGDIGDLPMIWATLRKVPSNAYGQVFIEAATPLQFEVVDAPEAVTVSWLYRGGPDGLRQPQAAHGSLAVRAVDAWVSEWLLEGASEAALVMWIGCMDSELVDDLYARMVERMPHLHVHHPHQFSAGAEGR